MIDIIIVLYLIPIIIGIKLMSDVNSLLASALALNAALVDVKSKLDAIAVLVSNLRAGSVDQAQIDAVAAALSSASDAVVAIKSEEDAIAPAA